MSDTPRTDAAELSVDEFLGRDGFPLTTKVVRSKVARDLERELNSALARIKELEAKLKAMGVEV